MVEKIIVNPESIRCWGNIVMEHTVEDYSLVGSSILVDSDTVMGVESTVYTIKAEDTTISVALVSSVASCSIGDSIVLSATVLDDDVAVEGGTVTFKLGSSTTLGTDETDSSGVATYTTTASVSGSNNFTAVYESHSSNTVSVVVSKLSTSTSLSLGSASIIVGSSTSASATVTSGGSGVSGLTVTFYDGSTSLGTGTTNSSGVAAYTLSGLAVGSHSITAVVTATDTYDTSTSSASTLTVLDHSYNIAFDSSSYSTSDGNVTAYVTLLDNSNPVSGASISLTGTGSTLSATTNSSGVATFNLTGISADCTITATYSNVSDTATITVQTGPLFYDDCSSSSGLSNYVNNVKVQRNPSTTLTFNTDEYVLSGTSCCFGGSKITAMDGVNNAKLRIKFKLNTTSSAAYNQFCIFCTDQNVDGTEREYPYGCRVRNDKLFQYFTIQNESTLYTHSTYYSSDWYYLEAEKDGTSWTLRLYDSSLSLLKENTRTLSSMTDPNWYIAILSEKGTNYSVHIKEVLAESL